ncbi:MAG: DUF1549 domain-containing protein, partial [Verrucomicrobiales bacterium]|nr:DUF1549 domain-containing protein [Verrucomicrobiales bacterium]
MKRLLSFFALTLTTPLQAADVDFNRDIRPLLSDRCFHCHGPDSHDRKANLRLDTTGGAEGAYRTIDGSTAIKPGDLESSELWHRITSADPDEVMPPPKSHKPALTEREKDLVRRWIEQGAAYQDFWAFVKPEKPATPQLENTAYSDHPVDGFVLRRLETESLSPNPPADPRTLARRLHLDLTGLPPTREELQKFLADTGPGAVDRLVERLLAKPQYGEHMAKYWLDLVRFADTNGIHHDHYREMSPYRNWVIRSFNDNLSYDKFASYQLAGDLFPYPTTDQLVASGFNRLHLIIDVGTALPEESLHRNIVDRVTAVGTAFMGLTVQCAVCHDHKYDPVTAKDFYALSAFFNNLDATPETGGRSGTNFKRGLQPPYIDIPNKTQKSELAELDKQIATATDDTQNKKLKSQRDNLMLTVPAAMVMKERTDIRPAHMLIRGAYDNPGEIVTRNTPAFLPPLEPATDLPTRLDLARWFTDPQNPLTARV